MQNSGPLIPRPFSVKEAKRQREEEARLAERREGATWGGVNRVGGQVYETGVQFAEALAAEEAARAAVEEKLDTAREELEAAGTERDTLIGETQQGLTEAGERLDAAEGTLDDAFGTEMDPLIAQKIAAGTATIQTADIKNLFVTDVAAMDTAVAEAIYTRKLAASKILADQVLIGSGANLFTDPKVQDAPGWANYFSATGGRSSGGSIVIPQGSAQRGVYYAQAANLSSRRTTLVPGGTYLISGWVKTSAAAPANTLRLYLRYQAAGSTTGAVAATTAGSAVATNAAPTVANTWTLVEGQVTIPDNTTYTTGVLGVFSEAGYTTGTATWADLGIQSATDSSLIVDGTVTARKLEAIMVLASRIVAGLPAGARAEMSPSGFRVYAADGTEVVRLGVAATDDYFAVTASDGTLVATIDQTGRIVGDSLYADTALYYKGDELATVLDRLAGGIEGWAQRTTYAAQNADSSTRMPYLRLNVPVKAGRFYKVSTTPIASEASDTATSTMLYLTYNYSGNAGTFDSTLAQGLTSRTTVNGNLQTPLPLSGITASAVNGYLSVLIAFQASGTGVVGLRGSTAQPVAIFVEDMGPQMYQAGISLDGTAPPATNVINYYKEYALAGASSYTGSNAYYAYMENKMFQGESPQAGVGNTKSIATYQSMTTDLAGATITAMRVYLYFDSWYYNAGGTARIGLHGHATPPATFSHSVADAMVVPGWPKPGGRWVDIPSTYWAGFKSGTYKGISLSAPGGDYQYYGIAAESSIISAAYTK